MSEPFQSATGLPSVADMNAARKRAGELFDRIPGPTLDPAEIARRAKRVDRAVEELGDALGIPTWHDLFDDDPSEGFFERIEDILEPDSRFFERIIDALEDVDFGESEEDEEEDEEEDDDGWDWERFVLAGAFLYWLLNREVETPKADFEFEYGAWEIDSVPVWVEELRMPGPPFAARTSDPMVHGGFAGPSSGARAVKIGNRPALTTADTSICPVSTPIGLPHISQQWQTNNGSVFVNNKPLLRAGDFMVEMFGGPNPIAMGCPTVLAGPTAPPVMVGHHRAKPLFEIIPGVERIGFTGKKIKVEVWASGNLLDTLVYAGADKVAGKAGIAFAERVFGIEGPTAHVSIEIDRGAFYAETRHDIPIDLWGDERPEHVQVVRTRPHLDRGTVTIDESWGTQMGKGGMWKSGMPDTKVEIDPPKPGIDVQTHEAGEEPDPWPEL